MTDSIPFASISDDELQSTVRRLTARSNGVLADLLAHLGEVELRGIHRTRACASLYTYCIYELRMSEDAAFRRAKAARLVREHPDVRDMVARGELHLTGLLMIGPYLGGERHSEILERARFRTKSEIARLIARLDPKPEVPALVEPIGPAPRALVTHREFVESLSGHVRTLALGQRPNDWIEPGDSGASDGEDATIDQEPDASHKAGPPRPATPSDARAREATQEAQAGRNRTANCRASAARLGEHRASAVHPEVGSASRLGSRRRTVRLPGRSGLPLPRDSWARAASLPRVRARRAVHVGQPRGARSTSQPFVVAIKSASIAVSATHNRFRRAWVIDIRSSISRRASVVMLDATEYRECRDASLVSRRLALFVVGVLEFQYQLIGSGLPARRVHSISTTRACRQGRFIRFQRRSLAGKAGSFDFNGEALPARRGPAVHV